MARRSLIAFLLLCVAITTVGMPVNVHACAMQGESRGSTCGMCAKADKDADTEKKGNGCCDDRIEIDHTDPARLAATVELPAPILSPLLLPPLPIVVEPATQPVTSIFSIAHSPPPERHGQNAYLFNASFLI